MSDQPVFIEGVMSYRVGAAAKLIGVSRATLYNARNRGDLEMGKIYGSTVIPAESLREFWRRTYKPFKAVG